MMHVYPVRDLREHDLEGTACECGPRVEFEDPATGEPYSEGQVVHRAFDCREVVEQAEAIIAADGA